MLILGISAYHPDSSACIIKNGRLIAAVEEERFRRIKHWAGFPRESVRYCLKEARIGFDEIDHIAVNRNPAVNLHKKFIFSIFNKPSISLIKNRIDSVYKIRAVKNLLAEEFNFNLNFKAKIHHIEHHRSHLASAFFVSPFDGAAAISIDGFGDFSSCMVAKGDTSRLKVLYEVNYPHSLGLFYTAFTQFLGFKKFGDEYKVMGLAGYGKPIHTKEMEDVLIPKPEGRFQLNLDYFSFHKRNTLMTWDNAEPTLEDVFSKKLIEKFGNIRKEDEKITQFHFDIAASAQAVYEKAFFHILNYAYTITKNSNLSLAGGCALNSLANGKIFDRTPFKEVYIQPAASDAGGALGAAYYLYNHLLGNRRTFTMDNAYWGPGFSEEEIKAEIENREKDLGPYEISAVSSDAELCKNTARLIADGKIVGWFQGRMEWGPRALGNRSILADPRRPDMKDILNERIKIREPFRPFAPSILVEKTGEYFEKNYPDPFMLKVYNIKEDKRALIPSVTHVDGTGRLQTVTKDENPLYYKLIKEFGNITGVPVLLNTSFNENEPIVCTPREAIDCFCRTKMDALSIGNFIIRKK